MNATGEDVLSSIDFKLCFLFCENSFMSIISNFLHEIVFSGQWKKVIVKTISEISEPKNI